MCFKEVSGFPPPGYRPEDRWMVSVRRWHPPVMLIFVLLIQNGFLPGWFSMIASTLLIGFSVFTLFVVWYLAFLLSTFKQLLNKANVIKRSEIFELIVPVMLTYVLWNGQWLWAFGFYGFSLCNVIALVLFFRTMCRKEKC